MRKREGIESRNESVRVGVDILIIYGRQNGMSQRSRLRKTYRDLRPQHVNRALSGTWENLYVPEMVRK